ncbi:MAG: dephospho-CoA kinase [Pontiellaceae bacterium]|jgi:dephospho-CoA kinase|nr:dephospho-CoA kinase [Pontiellaceae bacterium]
MNSHPSILLGITGGIACGKSETGRILSSEGFAVLDSDFLAHELMGKGRPVYAAVVGYFGVSVLDAKDEIDRAKLGQRVFDSARERDVLNRLVHPAVMKAAQEWIADCREVRRDAAVLVPLLFEAGWTEGWDAVLCVTAPEEQIFQRLEKRGLSNEEARKRIAAQMPLAEKAAQADFIVENGGTPDALRRRIMDLIEQIRRDKRKYHE